MVLYFATAVRHGGGRLPWRTLLFLALATVGYLIPGDAPEAWVYDRVAIAQGEIWRLVTGHWVHSDLTHALLDIGAFALIAAFCESRLQWRLPLALLAGTIGVDAWLWWIADSLHYYCGLSGILNCLLAVALVRIWRELRHPLVWLVGLGAVAKMLYEIFAGQAMLTHTAWPSVSEVHAVGFACGLALSLTFASGSRTLSRVMRER